MKRPRNPLSFTPSPVTTITVVVYIVVIASLLFVHHILPNPSQIDGVDLNEAWHDLQTLSTRFHPYNSHANDDVRHFLLQRIEEIAQPRNASTVHPPVRDPLHLTKQINPRGSVAAQDIVVFSDTSSNISSATNASLLRPGYSAYFEGTNVLVYIRGSDDDPSDWWLKDRKPAGDGGVLINAHYDSVATGFGATDDGVGIVTLLQLIKYYSSPQRQPKKGVVALFNNGEEDFLNGAKAFFQHPLSNFPQTFLNLEGAGAGGRATLFRSTNAEVTKAYQRSKYPVGTVISADGFKRGLIRSETDYSVFAPQGLQGLDVAFFEPRARYHTTQDDTKHTSRRSMYHMLSAAIATMDGLTQASSDDRGAGSDGVWFDLFGKVFAVLRLNTLLALSITLLVVSALTLSVIGFLLYRSDRAYILSGAKTPDTAEGGEPVSIKGIRGVFRWPIAFVLASVLVVVLAFLVVKCNPYIVYSSPYSVWAMFLSAWLTVAWICIKLADRYRPTAFQRLYTIMWQGLAAWIVHVFAAASENKQGLGGAYLVFFYHACIFLAATICLLELFGLPKKTDFASDLQKVYPSRGKAIPTSGNASTDQLISPTDDEGQPQRASDDVSDQDDEDEAGERTSLLRSGGHGRTTFKHYHTAHERAEAEDHIAAGRHSIRKVYGQEQAWSHSMPSYLWLIEFLIIAPFPLILFGQVSLILTSALYQTPADGGNPLVVYLAFGTFSVVLLSPLGPFLHRYRYHVPLFVFLILIGTLIYNLVAFPFSINNRLKVRFVQRLDLDTGLNNVTITGVSQGSYLNDIIKSLPSTYNQSIQCQPNSLQGLTDCNYTGLSPRIGGGPLSSTSNNNSHYASWLTFSINPLRNRTTAASFRIRGVNTRACKLVFSRPIRTFHVHGSGPPDPRFPKTGSDGSKELRLWSRTWDREWSGEIHWHHVGDEGTGTDGARAGAGVGAQRKGLSGHAVCLWSDANTPGTIPALDEIWKFAPEWAAVTKAQDGLVEGWKAWSL